MESAPLNAVLTVDTAALVANWRAFARASGGAECGAAIKAEGYGLGARGVLTALAAAGARDVFVAHWHEAAALGPLPEGVRVAVLHGVAEGEMAAALASPAVPVLVTAAQIAVWKPTGRPCDVMVDTGMNRLGISAAEAVSGLLEGLNLDTVHSHLACADTPTHPLNARQCADFTSLAATVPARRFALANSAGTLLGSAYHFGLTRPGIGIYGGGPGPDGDGLAAVAGISARILQVRDVPAGQSVGYGATFTAPRQTRLAIAALGYADGYPWSLSNRGEAIVGGTRCPLVGRVSMDLTAFDVSDAPDCREGGWIDIGFDLAATAAATGRTQYELLTGLGARYQRVYK